MIELHETPFKHVLTDEEGYKTLKVKYAKEPLSVDPSPPWAVRSFEDRFWGVPVYVRHCPCLIAG